MEREKLRESLDRRHARRLHLLRGVTAVGQRGRPRDAARDLEISRVVAVLAGDERVLTRSGGREEVHRLLAAHDPRLRGDGGVLEAAALERTVVRLLLPPKARVQPRLVAVERVRVLHDELAHAEEPAARPGLVAILDREVVEHLRQLPVALDLACVEGHGLLVRERKEELSPRAVLEVKELGDRDATGRLPQLARREHGHQHLLAADRVLLLAHDLRDLLVDTPAQWEKAPDPRAHLADVTPPDEQLVGHGLGVRGRLAQRRDEEP
jgi:hypothetical protein